jgi:hypothetical protein
VGALDGAPIAFEAADDVSSGGVLCALPALLAFGLLRHTRENFSLPKGFYPIETIFLTLAFLALARVRSLESLRYEPPGEWGKLLGLDRVPEVKTLREKVSLLCTEAGRAQRWSSALAKEWMMASDSDISGALYIDGHVRVYHGKLTKLPRRHVAREKLCLRGTTDYWVNAMDGQPFFVVTKPVDPGLLAVLTNDVVPRLKGDVPNQPTEDDLKRHPRRHRFTLVFDRAGYSPAFFEAMRKERVAILTYHKFPDADWNDEEFSPTQVSLIHGNVVTLDLAERGVRLSNTMWIREVRHRDQNGHQTSILSTDYESHLDRIACAMFARWCQENFFKYMLQHYGLDRLVEYGTEALPDATRVVNPAWRTLDSKVRREATLLVRAKAQFGALHVPMDAAAADTAAFVIQKSQALELVQQSQRALDALKLERKAMPHHVAIKDLPEVDRFDQLRGDKKHLVDTLKMIAYRAETDRNAVGSYRQRAHHLESLRASRDRANATEPFRVAPVDQIQARPIHRHKHVALTSSLGRRRSTYCTFESLHRGLVTFHEVVRAIQLARGAEHFGQLAGWILRRACRDVDQPCCPATVAQLGTAKRFPCPLLCFGHPRETKRRAENSAHTVRSIPQSAMDPMVS